MFCLSFGKQYLLHGIAIDDPNIFPLKNLFFVFSSYNRRRRVVRRLWRWSIARTAGAYPTCPRATTIAWTSWRAASRTSPTSTTSGTTTSVSTTQICRTLLTDIFYFLSPQHVKNCSLQHITMTCMCLTERQNRIKSLHYQQNGTQICDFVSRLQRDQVEENK